MQCKSYAAWCSALVPRTCPALPSLFIQRIELESVPRLSENRNVLESFESKCVFKKQSMASHSQQLATLEELKEDCFNSF